MIKLNYRSILNYFTNRSTNAAAETFNTKIKAFRAQFRGIKNTEFFYLDYQKFMLSPPTFVTDLLIKTNEKQ